MMGLDVHDMENLGEIWVGYNGQPKRVRSSVVRASVLPFLLEPGFVHTVEPGIYFIPELIDLWKGERSLKTSLIMIKWKNTVTSEVSAMKKTI